MQKLYLVVLCLVSNLSIIFSQQCWKSVHIGTLYSSAIKADGSLWAWGDNSYGLFGNGLFSDAKLPTQIGTARDWQFISAGGHHTLGIKTNGTLWAWGENRVGQLGIGNTSIGTFTPIQVGNSNNWKSVGVGAAHTIALKTDGTLWAWGQNDSGELGLGISTSSFILMPTQIGAANNWQSISVGETSNLAIRTDGTLWAWGGNNDGQLGGGNTSDKNIPTQIGTANNWQSVDVGYVHTLAIKTDGSLWAWGNYSGLGINDGTFTNKFIPTRVGTATNWQSVTANNYHSIATKLDGTLWAWGSNNYGQLGDGTNETISIPKQIGTATNWATVATGAKHTLARKTDGTIWAWGYNEEGQLGDSTNIYRVIPTLLKGCPTSKVPSIVVPQTCDAQLKLFPNPTENKFTISIENFREHNAKIIIFNLVGQIILIQNVNRQTEIIDLSQQPKGLYFVCFKTEKNGQFIQKLQKL